MIPAGDIVAQGGCALVMIVLCSITALAVALERLVALRRNRVIPPEVARATESYGDAADADAIRAVCRKHKGPFSRIIAATLTMRHSVYEQAVDRMRATGRVEVEKLEQGLTVLEIIAGAAPLLGLLGTVLGMMEVFGVITAEGIGDPQVLAGGISKALITTVAGLSVAIPTLACHSLLLRRISGLSAEMEERAVAFLLCVQHHINHEEDTQ